MSVPADCEVVAGVCDVVPAVWGVVPDDSGVVTVDWTGVVDELVVLVPVVVPAAALVVAELGTVPFAVGVVVGVVAVVGGRGAPAAGGSVEVPEPVTSAPFLAASATNPEASGEWMLPSAPPTSPPGLTSMIADGARRRKDHDPCSSPRRSIR